MLALVPALVLAAAAAPDLGVLHQYASVTLSADGKQIAAVETVRQPYATTDQHGAVVIRSNDGAVLARLDPCAKCKYAGVRWSPDGAKVVFTASADGLATLYGAGPDPTQKGSFAAYKIVALKGLLADPRWSPDGRSLAVLATAGARKESGALQAGAREVGEIGSTDDFRRIATVAPAGGELKFVSPDGTFVYEYDWTPDGHGFVATAAQGNGDNNWWVAKLQAFTLEGATSVIAAPAMQMNYPRVAPDGRQVAFIGGLMSDFGSVGGDVYVVDVGGGQPKNVTPGYKGSFTSLTWLRKKLVAGLVVGGEVGTASVDPAASGVTSAVTEVHLQPASLEAEDGEAAVALDRSGRHVAFMSQSFDYAPRIEYGFLGNTKPITHDNDSLKAPHAARDIHWKSDDFSVQGWLLSPTDVQAGKTYPMIVIVHGGPAAVVTPKFRWDDMAAGWLRNGYFVFEPNPRGSYGQGEAFTRANVRDFGGGDLRDDMAGIDAVKQVAPVDEQRLGLYGHSYGGYMTMWIETHSQRFKVAAAGAGIADWVAYYGQNGIDQWMIPYFGASAYDDPAVYDRLSPIRSIKAAHTPIFLYVGERDVECPMDQTREFWHGLQEYKVPNSLVIYADEGHHLVKPENVADLNHRLVDWFDRYLK